MHILQYGTGSTIAIIGFAIWPDLTSTQLLRFNTQLKPDLRCYSGKLLHDAYFCGATVKIKILVDVL